MAKRGKLHSCRRVKGGSCLCHKGKRQVFAKKSHCR
jgi:hypothetical protein